MLPSVFSFINFFFLNQPELAVEFDLNFQVISASSHTASSQTLNTLFSSAPPLFLSSFSLATIPAFHLFTSLPFLPFHLLYHPQRNTRGLSHSAISSHHAVMSLSFLRHRHSSPGTALPPAGTGSAVGDQLLLRAEAKL